MKKKGVGSAQKLRDGQGAPNTANFFFFFGLMINQSIFSVKIYDMTSHDDDRLDFSKLQKELDAAVVEDARYWRENDAKIRAVTEQKVQTYDEFK